MTISEDLRKQLESMNVDVDAFISAFIKAWEAIKKFVNAFKEWILTVMKVPGYKRKAKKRQLEYYKSISAGRSNNWRKIHGLHLIRDKC